MVDLSNYQCRCGDIVSVMQPKCPRCGTARFDPPSDPHEIARKIVESIDEEISKKKRPRRRE